MRVQKKTLKIIAELAKDKVAIENGVTKKEVMEITGAKSSTVNAMVNRGVLSSVEDERVSSVSDSGRTSKSKRYVLSNTALELLEDETDKTPAESTTPEDADYGMVSYAQSTESDEETQED